MKSCSFVLLREPRGKGRPRFANKGGYTVAYTPKETTEYEKSIRMAFWEQCKGWNTDSPVRVAIKAYYQIPKSTTKKDYARMISNEIRPCKKPDIDNVCKIVLDALNGYGFTDDTYVVNLSAVKHYSDNPRVEVYITEVGEGDDDNGIN